MSEQANPSSGWLTTDVQQTLSPAPEDWYGKLYFFLHKVLEKFLGRLKDLRVSFDIYNVDAKELLLNLKQGIYSRIEVRSSFLDTDIVHTNLEKGGQYQLCLLSRNLRYAGPIISSPTIATTEPARHAHNYVYQRS
jgi:hypothetical protein